MGEIADFLECPDHCLPVTSMVVGWPAEAPPQRDRLPGTAWIHDERYRRPTPADIDAHYAERERRGRERYLALGPEMARGGPSTASPRWRSSTPARSSTTPTSSRRTRRHWRRCCASAGSGAERALRYFGKT
jgi:hypothetical protein